MLLPAIQSGSIVVISLLFGLALLVAWWQLDRERHVGFWAISFFAAAVEHALRIGGSVMPAQQGLFAMLACHASVASFVFLALGFRLRALRGKRFLLICWAVSIMALLGAWVSHGLEWRTASRMVMALSDALMLGIIVHTLRPARGAAARLTQWTLALYCLYLCNVGLVAWMARPGGEVGDGVFLIVMSICTPTGMIGSGILTLLIVASDLARGLRKQARTDVLTGLLNRRGIDEEGALLFERAGDEPVVVAVADLDYFKAINDRLGHAAGDEVLRRFALHLRANLRAQDLVARLGGEEFVLVLPYTSLDDAARRVETIRAGVAPAFARMPGMNGMPGISGRERRRAGQAQNRPSQGRSPETAGLSVTASFGVTLREPAEHFAQALLRADTALYQAKHDGRDRVVVDRRAPRTGVRSAILRRLR